MDAAAVSELFRGGKNLDVYLSNNGRTYGYDPIGGAISIKVTCQFVPKHGKKSISTATVVTDA